MKIVHIAPAAPYNEGWGYQENLLTKYQAIAGHDVTLIVRNQKHENGKIVDTDCEDYFSLDGFRVIRMKPSVGMYPRSFRKLNVYDLLCEIKPDFIFYHGLASSTIFDAVKYKKRIKPGCVIVQDNHMDYNIGNKADSVTTWLLRECYRMIFRMTKKHVSKVYGVTPWRKKYAEDYFRVPSTMTDVLIMGADDQKIDFSRKAEIRRNIRQNYEIKDTDFLIVTGGKIDLKKKIHYLMEAANQCDNVKLLIFGDVKDDVKVQFEKNLSDQIIYIGWVDADKVYDYFFAADIVMFPGQHSVLWEQACASKVPCVFEKWEGMDHVNNGGNADFVDGISVESLKEKIQELNFTNKYMSMKEISESEKTDIYLYSKIAERSVECYE